MAGWALWSHEWLHSSYTVLYIAVLVLPFSYTVKIAKPRNAAQEKNSPKLMYSDSSIFK